MHLNYIPILLTTLFTLLTPTTAIPATGLPQDGVIRWKVRDYYAISSVALNTQFEFHIEGDNIVYPNPKQIPGFNATCTRNALPLKAPSVGTDWLPCLITDSDTTSKKISVRIMENKDLFDLNDAKIQFSYVFVNEVPHERWNFTSAGTQVNFRGSYVKEFNVDNLDKGHII